MLWSKSSVNNRGLVADADPIPADERKTALQKNAILEQMLGLIAQYAPALLRNDIMKKSTSIGWIWNRIRQHYGFQQSEVNFLNIYKIRREDGERYETLYQRLYRTSMITCLQQEVTSHTTVLLLLQTKNLHLLANVSPFIFG